jgi:MATE family multidrug resistance protein
MLTRLRQRLRPGGSTPGGYLEIGRIAYPLIVMSASHTIMQFTDRKFLAMNSTEDVAAALPAGILSFTLFSFFMVTTSFTSALVAQHHGNRDPVGCVRAAWSGFYFALAAAALILLALPWLGLGIITAGNHPAAILARERNYFIALIPSGAFVCLGVAFSAYFSGQGKTWNVALINLFACALNIALDYLLIFGKWGCPALGIAGAGIATSIASLVSFLCAMAWFLLLDQQRHPTRRHWRISWADIRKLLAFGSPAGLQCFLDVGAFTAITFLIGNINPEAMAVTTIALSINMISFLPLLGLSDATAIVVGQYIGRNRHDVAEQVAWRSWRMASGYMLVAGLIFLVFPTALIGFFAPGGRGAIDFAAILAAGRPILACAAVFNFFDATKFIFMGSLRGAGDTKVLMLICVSGAWLLMVPGVVLLILVVKASVVAVWIYLTAYLLVECLAVLWRFRSGAWKKIEMIQRGAPLETAHPDGPVPIE